MVSKSSRGSWNTIGLIAWPFLTQILTRSLSRPQRPQSGGVSPRFPGGLASPPAGSLQPPPAAMLQHSPGAAGGGARGGPYSAAGQGQAPPPNPAAQWATAQRANQAVMAGGSVTQVRPVRTELLLLLCAVVVRCPFGTRGLGVCETN